MSLPRRIDTADDLPAAVAETENGDKLVLEKGYHTIDAPLRSDANNVTIIGQGMGSSIVRRTGDFPIVELIGTQRRGDRRSKWIFRDVAFASRRDDEAALIYAQYGGSHHFENVRFDTEASTGDGVYAEECWDLKFTNCSFNQSGDADGTSAGVYVYNGDYDMSNSYQFINCTWNGITGYALFSDTSGAGPVNDRFYVANCKFRGHGRGGRTQKDPHLYYIDGNWHDLKIVNSHFRWSLAGFVRCRVDGRSLQVSNCAFQQYGNTAVDVTAPNSIVANNAFVSERPSGRAVRVTGADSVVVGNNIRSERGIAAEAPYTRIFGNTVAETMGAAVRVTGDSVVVLGNSIHDSRSDGVSVYGDDVVVSSNVIDSTDAAGVRLDGVGLGVVTGNRIRGVGAGIVAESSSSLLVSANLLADVVDDALSVDNETSVVETNLVE